MRTGGRKGQMEKRIRKLIGAMRMGAGGEKEGGTGRRMEDGDRGVYKGEDRKRHDRMKVRQERLNSNNISIN